MSDEYKDAKWWIERYPFLQIKNNYACPWIEANNDVTTWLDEEIPEGWKIGFGKQMCDDLMEALGDYADKWEIMQMKEKFAEIRIYHTGVPKEIYDKVKDVIDKYTDISYNTCCVCGKEATKYSEGWILPYCDEHYRS